MEQQEIQPSSPVIGIIIAGYCLAILGFLFVPVIFMSFAIICGLICFGYNRIEHGLFIIILAVILGCYGASIGGWGLGLPKFHL